MKYSDIPQFTQEASYRVNQPLDHMCTRPSRNLSPERADGPLGTIKGWLDSYIEDGLQIEPDFQRNHVWSPDQQRAYIEYRLRGGNMTGRHIYLNHPRWLSTRPVQPGEYNDFVLVDGLQRITAARKFMNNELAIFDDHYLKDFEGPFRAMNVDFIVCVNTLRTRAQVLQWYCDLNEGGVVHTKAEIARVRELLAQEK